MRKFVLIVIAICFVMSAVGCRCNVDSNEETQVYHESVEDIERYVLCDMEKYIIFKEPIFEYGQIQWFVEFKDSYIKTNDYELTPLEVIERTRLLINDYVSQNPDSILTKQYVIIEFYEKTEETYPSTKDVGFIDNGYTESNRKHEGFYTLKTYSKNWEVLYGSDLKCVTISSETDERIIEIIENLPDLETVALYDEEQISRLEKKYENISFEPHYK